MKLFLHFAACLLLWVPLHVNASDKKAVTLTTELQRKVTDFVTD
jgi:hypothetical protein